VRPFPPDCWRNSRLVAVCRLIKQPRRNVHCLFYKNRMVFHNLLGPGGRPPVVR